MFYPAKGGEKEKQMIPIAVQGSGRTYWQAGNGQKSTYSFDKDYKEVIIFFTKSKLGGEITFSNCSYEKVDFKNNGLGNSSVAEIYRLTNVKPETTITAYSYTNQIEDGPGVDSCFAIFTQE